MKATAEVLGEIEGAPDKGIPNDLFHKSSCAVAIPGMFCIYLFPGKYGRRNFASCRKPDGGWTPLVSLPIEGGGFGLQAGGSATYSFFWS